MLMEAMHSHVLWKNSLSPPTASGGGSVWTRLSSIPTPHEFSLATLEGRVLAIGGADDDFGRSPTAAIHCYDVATNSWSVGEMPTPRSTAVLPSNQLVVVGVRLSLRELRLTEICSSDNTAHELLVVREREKNMCTTVMRS
jgi:hypothetical protein